MVHIHVCQVPGGYSHILTIQVFAALQGMVFNLFCQSLIVKSNCLTIYFERMYTRLQTILHPRGVLWGNRRKS